MKLNKKITMGVLAAVAVVAPIVTVVSCGSEGSTKLSKENKQKLEKLQKETDSKQSQIDTLKKEKADIQAKLDDYKKDLQKQIDDLKKASTTKATSSNTKAIDDLKTKLAGFEIKIKSLNGRIFVLESDKRNLQKEINTLKQAKTDLEGKVTALEKTKTDLEARIKALETKATNTKTGGTTSSGPKPITYLKTNKLKKTDTLDVKDDVVLLTGAYYTGTINDIYDGTKDGIGVINQKTDRYDLFDTAKAQAVMLNNEDSFIYAFDKDNTDGLTVDNFIKTHWFMDTSVNWSKETKAINEKVGAFRKDYDTMIPFKGTIEKGESIPYFGSQNNHSNLTWQQAMDKIKAAHPKYYPVLVDYYRQASKSFIPIVTSTGDWLTYEKIATNAIKVSFHNINKRPITAAALVTKPDLPNAKYSYVGPLSISPQDHHSYHKGGYTILGDHK